MNKNRLNEDAVQDELTRTPFFKPQLETEYKNFAVRVEQHPAPDPAQKFEQHSEQNFAQMSKPGFSGDEVETLEFSLRKTPKAKLNALIPVAWKEEIDRMALDLKVGKYELAAYLVGKALGKVD